MPQYTSKFRWAWGLLTAPEIEGVHSDDPADAGGDTWWGIARASHPDEPWPPTFERATEIAHDEYWTPLRCDDLRAPLALLLFDMGFNSGTVSAARLLQAVIGGLRIDGRIGPVTIEAAARCDIRRTGADFQARRVMTLMHAGNWTRFGHGWLVRSYLQTASAYDME
jgi:lysozyme family protein